MQFYTDNFNGFIALAVYKLNPNVLSEIFFT